MKITHIAIWVKDLEAVKAFYTSFFNAKSNEMYHNPQKDFTSYFLSFPGNDVRLELMHNPEVPVLKPSQSSTSPGDQYLGIIHFAISVGSKEEVDSLTEQIRKTGHQVLGEPRTTGDGYYESVVSDPEGNLVEITE